MLSSCCVAQRVSRVQLPRQNYNLGYKDVVYLVPTPIIYQDSFRQPRFKDTWRSITADRRHGAPPLCPRVSPHILVITLEHPSSVMVCWNVSTSTEFGEMFCYCYGSVRLVSLAVVMVDVVFYQE